MTHRSEEEALRRGQAILSLNQLSDVRSERLNLIPIPQIIPRPLLKADVIFGHLFCRHRKHSLVEETHPSRRREVVHPTKGVVCV